MIRTEIALAATLMCVAPIHSVGLASQDTANDESKQSERTLVVEPSTLTMQVGDRVELKATVREASGEVIDEEVFYFSRKRRSVSVDDEGMVEALSPGSFTIVARTRRAETSDDDSEAGEGQEGRAAVVVRKRLSTEVKVVIMAPPLDRIEIERPAGQMYAGTDVDLVVRAIDVKGGEWTESELEIGSSDPTVASLVGVDRLRIHKAGRFSISAKADDINADGESSVVQMEMNAEANPIASLSLSSSATTARTGDVVHFEAIAQDASGTAIQGVPIQLSFSGTPDDSLGEPAGGQIEQDGRFVAEQPGDYTIVATSGNAYTRTTIRIDERKVGGHFELVGRGKVNEYHTSDLWVWQGIDGRDYAVTGTWGAEGDALFWDVTDPENIERISKITVDARTVNDVKVSQDGRICVISREGASDRKNGIVLVDVSNPREPKIISTFDEELTGGVHNVFIDGDTVYALSAGRRYDIIDISDARSPRTVSKFELDSPGHSIHDVWVTDGLAYSSNWSDGVQIVDVGNGIKGGSPSNPVKVASYAYPSGWNHAAYPFKSKETGRTYVVAGDEAFPYGLSVKDKPTYPRGWLHFIDFTDLDNPDEVARYQVPEAGTHNLWIEDSICYVGYYNAGIRAVDVSGELLGDLYRQGREIAWYLPTDSEGYIPNAPMVWGPQPYKGNIFFSDWNTGLWCVKLVTKEEK
ncbi:MAG: hypothetical protein ACI841_004327 [Planctomycetota bacterium]|jgi:hypothetical protein